jgi:hypothetical protein
MLASAFSIAETTLFGAIVRRNADHDRQRSKSTPASTKRRKSTVGCPLTSGLARSRDAGERRIGSYVGSRGALFQWSCQGDDTATNLTLVEGSEAKGCQSSLRLLLGGQSSPIHSEPDLMKARNESASRVQGYSRKDRLTHTLRISDAPCLCWEIAGHFKGH